VGELESAAEAETLRERAAEVDSVGVGLAE
jgi:hypothetical protein